MLLHCFTPCTAERNPLRSLLSSDMADTDDPTVDEGAGQGADQAPAPASPASAAAPAAEPPAVRKTVGAVTKVSPSKSGAKSPKRGAVPAAWGPGNWNRFNRDVPPSRPRINLTKTSKSEMTKRHQWDDEKRCVAH